MNKIKFCAIFCVAFVLGLGLNNFALSSATQYKVGIVDVAKVVEASPQIATLKKEQAKKAENMRKWVDTVKKEIDSEKDAKKKADLVKKYDKMLQDKQRANLTESQKKLSAVDNSISKVITDKSKALGYNLVIAKSVVLYGGNDITAEIIKSIK